MAIAVGSKPSAAPAPQRVDPSARGAGASSASQGSSRVGLPSALHTDRFQSGSASFGVGARARIGDGATAADKPVSGMTDNSLNKVIDQGWKDGTLTPTNAIRAHFAANQMLGLRPWEHTRAPAQEISAEQMREGLSKTAGTSTGDAAAPSVSDQRLGEALNYVNGARDASDQRRRITKALEGLYVESKSGGDKGDPEPLSNHKPVGGKDLGTRTITASCNSLRRGIYNPGSSSGTAKPIPVETNPSGIILPPEG